ncbi:hypothetical protein Ga0609869_000781 [Rhodovulum iodosum]|uniref:Uncharacterized protein n=1 Tax=Rhodovulum iodosum TaxID=68291 RepID=A0ABV3XQ23_9RHOB|nr:hypothetical protein [Rhodovulum robiginosum]RSK31298.1 hypothetical protein EJA01_14195 [Rhodovulum robiginosum]
MPRLIPLLPCLFAALPLWAEPAEIVAATAEPTRDTWRFSVTLRHPDTGWEHYADGWEVLAPDGTRIGLRKLLHPHVDEQPFTRSLTGVAVPAGATRITIRARCSRDGWTGTPVTLDLKN